MEKRLKFIESSPFANTDDFFPQLLVICEFAAEEECFVYFEYLNKHLLTHTHTSTKAQRLWAKERYVQREFHDKYTLRSSVISIAFVLCVKPRTVLRC